jgi:hypothetical protein
MKNLNNMNIKNQIFIKNLNNKYKSTPLNIKVNAVGSIKYFPAASKEWKNKIYFFNQNKLKNLSIYNINLYKLIRTYLNLYFSPNILFKARKFNLLKRLKYSSKNIIYISKPEIKHTGLKTIITVYTYNRQKLILKKKIKKIRRLIRKIRIFLLKKLSLWKLIFSNTVLKETFKKLFKKELTLIKKYKFKLSLNKLKFKSIYIYKFAKIISRFFNTKIEFNVINLRSIIYNSDIFTDFITRKIRTRKRKKRIKLLRIMRYVISKINISKINKLKERGIHTKSINFNLIENKYKNININAIINKNNFDNIIRKLFKEKYSSLNYNKFALTNNDKKTNTSKLLSTYKNIIYKYIKYKKIGGIRIEISGRLTRRYRADRAIYKLKWKGSLQNLDSSLKRLSAVNFRGYSNSNLEYSILASKRRIGAFAVKGWITGTNI